MTKQLLSMFFILGNSVSVLSLSPHKLGRKQFLFHKLVRIYDNLTECSAHAECIVNVH